jgi:thymidine kinase
MAGKIEVITGPMKCGKSEEVLRRVKRFKIAELNVLVVKPSTDKRFSEDEVISRDDRKADCTVVPTNNPEYIYALLDNSVDIIVIDEVQFFNKGIVPVVQWLKDIGYHVIVAGLDMTSERKPFGPMPELMAIADNVLKLKSVCEDCKKEEAMYTFATFEKTEDVVVGDTEYIALCSECYLNRLKELRRA